jgi:hypothetical protein
VYREERANSGICLVVAQSHVAASVAGGASAHQHQPCKDIQVRSELLAGAGGGLNWMHRVAQVAFPTWAGACDIEGLVDSGRHRPFFQALVMAPLRPLAIVLT